MITLTVPVCGAELPLSTAPVDPEPEPHAAVAAASTTRAERAGPFS